MSRIPEVRSILVSSSCSSSRQPSSNLPVSSCSSFHHLETYQTKGFIAPNHMTSFGSWGLACARASRVRKVTAIDGANLVRSPSASGMAARRWQRVVNNVADAGDNVFASGCTPSNAMSFRTNPLSLSSPPPPLRRTACIPSRSAHVSRIVTTGEEVLSSRDAHSRANEVAEMERSQLTKRPSHRLIGFHRMSFQRRCSSAPPSPAYIPSPTKSYLQPVVGDAPSSRVVEALVCSPV
eukprot:scaffold158427_cov39-Tisochrysis_lutea.AAC.1